jgi:hypothetical protein
MENEPIAPEKVKQILKEQKIQRLCGQIQATSKQS